MPKPFPYDDYMPFLAGFDLSDTHKHAIIDTLWVMMSGLVDTADAAADGETIPCGQLGENERHRPAGLPDEVQWKSINTTHEFARASGSSAPSGEESP